MQQIAASASLSSMICNLRGCVAAHRALFSFNALAQSVCTLSGSRRWVQVRYLDHVRTAPSATHVRQGQADRVMSHIYHRCFWSLCPTLGNLPQRCLHVEHVCIRTKPKTLSSYPSTKVEFAAGLRCTAPSHWQAAIPDGTLCNPCSLSSKGLSGPVHPTLGREINMSDTKYAATKLLMLVARDHLRSLQSTANGKCLVWVDWFNAHAPQE